MLSASMDRVIMESDSSTGEKIIVAFLGVILLSSIAALAYQLILIPSPQSSIEIPLKR